MSNSMKTVWLPGLSGLFFSAVVLLILTRLLPATWINPLVPLTIGAPWIFSYLFAGSLGAFLSRRAGGHKNARFLAGTFPLSLHLLVFIVPVLAALISPAPRFREHLMLSFLVQASVLWLAVPGVLLTLGTLPFLRDSRTN